MPSSIKYDIHQTFNTQNKPSKKQKQRLPQAYQAYQVHTNTQIQTYKLHHMSSLAHMKIKQKYNNKNNIINLTKTNNKNNQTNSLPTS